jgi:hypothetical protein
MIFSLVGIESIAEIEHQARENRMPFLNEWCL